MLNSISSDRDEGKEGGVLGTGAKMILPPIYLSCERLWTSPLCVPQ